VAEVILVEADGSRQRPLKAPDRHEPVIPEAADMVCPMVGIDALGEPLSSLSVHRPQLVARIHQSDVVTEALVVAVVTSARGGLKGAPPKAAIRPIINKVADRVRGPALNIAHGILKRGPDRLDRVVVADIRGEAFAAVLRPQG
jgi:probable selenium-dependent hydroxylase accessory protein YqeC